MVAHVYDGSDNFVNHSIPPYYNDKAYGRPALATINETTLMAWRQTDGKVSLAEARMIQGRLFTSPLSFDGQPYGQLALTATDLAPSPVGDPVLSTDGQYFYLAVIQSFRGGGAGTLHGWSVVLYKSEGDSLYSGWTEYGRFMQDATNQSEINLALREIGARVAAMIRKVHDTTVLQAKFYPENALPSQDLGSSPWLGATKVAYRPFGLTRFGVNAPAPPVLNPPKNILQPIR